MYIKTRCTQCGSSDYHNIKLHAFEKAVFEDFVDANRYLIDHIEVAETISEEEMAQAVFQELRGYVYDGVTVRELCRILKECFGVVARYCCDVIQRLKIEMDMYSPDHQHLYFVEGARV